MRFVVAFWMALCCTQISFAATIYVPDDFTTIQDAIDNANNHGDIVVIRDGTYSGEGNRNIDFRGKAITVKSENGPKNCVILNTTQDLYSCFLFSNAEFDESILEGLTIEGFYFGIQASSSPIINNCIIQWCHNGFLFANYSQIAINNCVVLYNETAFMNGSAREVKVTNCTVTRNTFVFDNQNAKLVNCIIWNNTNTDTVDQSYASYCDLQYVEPTGTNISADPMFVGSGDYYHLTSSSPCIDKGSATDFSPVDIDGTSRPKCARPDIGATEFICSDPVADAGTDQVVSTKVTFDGSGSHSYTTQIVSYHWDIISRSSAALNKTAEGMSPTVSGLANGYYDVTLTVTDDHGMSDADQMVLSATGFTDKRVVVIPLN